MDDMGQIADRFAAIARGMVDQSAAVAQQVFTKTNPETTNPEKTNPETTDPAADPQGRSASGTFTAANAVASMAELVDIAVRGSVATARIPLQTEPDRNVLLAADHVASVLGRGVSQATEVISDATRDMEQNGFDKDRIAESTVRLASLAMLRGAEIMQTIAAGPGRYRDPSLSSDEFTVTPDPDHDRLLEMVTLARPDVDENIAHIVRFIPADRILLRNNGTFRLTANSAGIPSGVYQGTVRVSRVADPEEHQLIEVLFAL